MKKSLVFASIVGLASVGLAACSLSGNANLSASPSPTDDTSMIEMSPSPTDDAMMMSPSPMMSPMASGQGVMVGGAMMVSTNDIITNAKLADNLTTAVSAVDAAGLTATLQGKGPFTVFAPTDDAFNKLPAGTVATLMQPANKAKLASILKYHVVAGRYTSANLKDGQTLKTLEGDTLTVHNTAGQWTVTDTSGNTANITTADVIDSNGVSFIIDTVLMPKN